MHAHPARLSGLTDRRPWRADDDQETDDPEDKDEDDDEDEDDETTKTTRKGTKR